MIRHRRGFIDPSSGRPGSPHTAGAIQVQSGMRYGNPIRIRVTPGFIGSSFGIGATRSLPSEPENTVIREIFGEYATAAAFSDG